MWTFQTGGEVNNMPRPCPRSVYTNDIVYFGSDDSNLYALDTTKVGKLKWKFQADEAVQTSPYIDGDGIVYFGSYDSSLYAGLKTDISMWSTKMAPSSGSSRQMIGSAPPHL